MAIGTVFTFFVVPAIYLLIAADKQKVIQPLSDPAESSDLSVSR